MDIKKILIKIDDVIWWWVALITIPPVILTGLVILFSGIYFILKFCFTSLFN